MTNGELIKELSKLPIEVKAYIFVKEGKGCLVREIEDTNIELDQSKDGIRFIAINIKAPVWEEVA